jgi:VIT1/CCC1 family predicted Fe2+/Mn2+ transporter
MAGLVGGSLSMAVGEFVSVSSQRDVERADLDRERTELSEEPERELEELARLLSEKGMSAETSRTAARELTEHDALRAHAIEELGIRPDELARPMQAALVSALAFALGAALPLIAIAFSAPQIRMGLTATATLLTLAVVGGWSARLGGAPSGRAIARLVAGGIIAMGLTALIGRVFGAAIG